VLVVVVTVVVLLLIGTGYCGRVQLWFSRESFFFCGYGDTCRNAAFQAQHRAIHTRGRTRDMASEARRSWWGCEVCYQGNPRILSALTSLSMRNELRASNSSHFCFPIEEFFQGELHVVYLPLSTSHSQSFAASASHHAFSFQSPCLPQSLHENFRLLSSILFSNCMILRRRAWSCLLWCLEQI
jgi:hypothetical protein